MSGSLVHRFTVGSRAFPPAGPPLGNSLSLEAKSAPSLYIYIVGGVYRHPGYNIKTFCTNLENSVEHVNKSNIPCIIAGDFNIDLTKYDKNRDRSDLLTHLPIHSKMYAPEKNLF